MKVLKEKGITLIALVVTIIILLILAGVTLALSLGEGGIFSRAKQAVDSYGIESEKEYLQQIIASAKMEEIENGSANKLGEELNKKDLEHSSNWHILKVNDKSYDTGNYVKKGTELPGYGKTQNSWILNYDTGEIIQLEEENCMSLSATDTMEVKDHIIFNLDSSIIDGDVSNTKAGLEKVLGEGVELHGFDYNEKSGLTNTSFNFDGVNDYITLPFKGDPEKMFDGGFTLEFYGIFNGPGHEMLDDGTEFVRTGTSFDGGGTSGLFQIVNEEQKGYGLLSFLREKNYSDFGQINWQIGNTSRRAPNGLGGVQGDDQEGKSTTWDRFYLKDHNVNVSYGDIVYITITYDGDNNVNSIYLNGKSLLVAPEMENTDVWNKFIQRVKGVEKKHIEVGRYTFAEGSLKGASGYLEGSAYCFRIYGRSLSEKEVLKNYEKTVESHNLIEE